MYKYIYIRYKYIYIYIYILKHKCKCKVNVSGNFLLKYPFPKDRLIVFHQTLIKWLVLTKETKVPVLGKIPDL